MPFAELGGSLHANVALVIGTRPEAIKLAPVANALVVHGIVPRLILTGQHPNLAIGEFGLAGFPLVQLRCPGMEDPHRHVGAVERAISSTVKGLDLVMVQGDTSSAMGGTLAALTQNVPIAHVEAGLRTFDPVEPWPEEEYRTAIDAHSDLLFAPTELSAGNLRNEGLEGEIHVTGNSGIDALVREMDHLPQASLRSRQQSQILVTCHRRENWGERLGSIIAAATELAASGDARIDFILPPNPSIAAAIAAAVHDVPAIRLIEARPYRQMLMAMRDCDLILSDSGGLQEEAPALGVPLLVLRDKTERPEALASGNVRLVGTDKDRIIAAVRQILSDPVTRAQMSRPAFPFGDGRAGPRIAAIVEQWLKAKYAVRRRA